MCLTTPSGRCNWCQLPLSKHVCALPEVARVFLWGDHEGASPRCHHGKGLPPELSMIPAPLTNSMCWWSLSCFFCRKKIRKLCSPMIFLSFVKRACVYTCKWKEAHLSSTSYWSRLRSCLQPMISIKTSWWASTALRAWAASSQGQVSSVYSHTPAPRACVKFSIDVLFRLL